MKYAFLLVFPGITRDKLMAYFFRTLLMRGGKRINHTYFMDISKAGGITLCGWAKGAKPLSRIKFRRKGIKRARTQVLPNKSVCHFG